MEPASFLGGIFEGGLWTLMPLLSVAAVIDIVRTRAEWYWIWVVLFFQGIGPIAYFAVSYGPWSAGSVGQLSPAAARRVEARRRLRELQIQLGHWRGPSVLAEAGEQLLALGRYKDAEAHLREAREAGAGPKEANLALAQLLQVRGARYAESRPLLEELDSEDSDYRFGAARLALARSLDETGEAEDAETLLRALIEKRNLPEGKVRLARLLLRRGEAEQARELLLQLGSDGATMPKYLKRQHGAWLRAGRRLRTGKESLPGPSFEDTPSSLWRWWSLVLAGLLTLVFLVLWLGG